MLAGVGAGLVSTVCMHPLDMLKVQYQVSTKGVGGIVGSLRRIASGPDGARALYRGLSPNLVGNASSWGFYFLWYTLIKARMAGDDPSVRLNAGQHLLASASSGVITAFMTNPLWVVKTRMFTSSRQVDPLRAVPYRGVIDGLTRLAREEGIRGLYRGNLLALVGVSNGAIQFMSYEELKRRTRDRKRRRRGETTLGGEYDAEPLSNLEYIVLSGSAKLFSTACTYPYQTVRSRLQNQAGGPDAYRNIRDCVRRTWRHEGLRAFYRGLWPSAIRVLPGTCVTFVVYENIAGWLRQRANAELAVSRSDGH